MQEVWAPILEPVTKLGGQPVWLSEPQWPLSRALGTPMRFIGQFALSSDLFSSCEAQLAYLFMTDTDTFVNGTWLPDGGENAVILQPGPWDGPVATLTRGPTLCERILSPDHAETQEQPREYVPTRPRGLRAAIAYCNAQLERWAKCVEMGHAALERADGLTASFYSLGLGYNGLGQSAHAAAAFDRALSTHSNLAGAWVGKARPCSISDALTKRSRHSSVGWQLPRRIAGMPGLMKIPSWL